MLIFICRHGQTDWNRMGRWQSRSEIPLNDAGLAQGVMVAKAVKRLLDELTITRVKLVCSPMGRAKQTAGMIAEQLGITMRIEPSFIELDLGEFEGKMHADLIETYGETFNHWLESYHRIAAPAGESLADGMNRAETAFSAYLGEVDVQSLIVVAHQGINIALKTLLSGGSLDAINDETLASYKQSNTQIDLWQWDRPSKIATYVRRVDVSDQSG